MQASGTLYVIATPIGNLADISQRAITLLGEVDVIAAEDTRHSQRLLQQFQITTRCVSLHDHNEQARAQQLITWLSSGQHVALISDAGTPLISDPGYTLVNQCRQAGIRVVPVPGACAAIAALSASGLPTDRFRFCGFLPVKQQAKEKTLGALSNASETHIFYEAPRRIADTVALLVDLLEPEQQIVLAKELTKAFETFVAGSAAEVMDWLQQDAVHQKGEFVLMIGPASQQQEDIPQEAMQLLHSLQAELPLKKAAALVAQHYGLKKNQLYQAGLASED